METRISAIAQLYDLISRSAAFGPVQVGEYLEGIAETLSKSLLGDTPTIHIRVEAEPLAVAAEHAVTTGLLVIELATNAVTYAFPNGPGKIALGLGQIGRWMGGERGGR